MAKSKLMIAIKCVIFFISVSIIFQIDAKEIPEDIKNNERKLILESENYVEPSRIFVEKIISNSDYKVDLKKFYRSFINKKELNPITRVHLLLSLIELGEVKYLNSLIELKAFDNPEKDTKYKLYFLGQVYQSMHESQSNTHYHLDGISSFNTDSFESYRDSSHSPDFAFDGNFNTYWKIANINNIKESTLELRAYFKDFDIKIYFLKTLNGVQLPVVKEIKLHLSGGESKEVIREKVYKIINNKEYYNFKFNSGFIGSLFEKTERYYNITITFFSSEEEKHRGCNISEIVINKIN